MFPIRRKSKKIDYMANFQSQVFKSYIYNHVFTWFILLFVGLWNHTFYVYDFRTEFINSKLCFNNRTSLSNKTRSKFNVDRRPKKKWNNWKLKTKNYRNNTGRRPKNEKSTMRIFTDNFNLKSKFVISPFFNFTFFLTINGMSYRGFRLVAV